MFCSISTTKSNSTWLDRLRSSKGFSSDSATNSGAGTGADQTKPTDIFTEQTDPEAQFSSIPSTSEVTPFLGDVLAELFAFGPDPPKLPSKKNPRKLANPKCCKVNRFDNDLDLRVLEVQRSGGSRREGGEEKEKGKGKGREREVVVVKKRFLGEEEEEEEEEEMDLNLSGFSRTEVAVIDTSCKGWKFEKVLFRKKSVWKIRDRKSRGFDFESSEKKKMKKRKLSAGKEEEEEGVGVCKKKKKIVFGQCSSSKEGKRGKFSMQINDELHRRLSAEEEEVGACKKKKKIVFGQCSSSKEGKRGDFSMQISDELHRKLSAEEEEVGVFKKKKKIVFGQCSSSKGGKRGDFSMRRNDEEVGKGKLICYT